MQVGSTIFPLEYKTHQEALKLQEHTIQPPIIKEDIPIKKIVDGLSFNQLAFEWYQSEQHLEKKVRSMNLWKRLKIQIPSCLQKTVKSTSPSFLTTRLFPPKKSMNIFKEDCMFPNQIPNLDPFHFDHKHLQVEKVQQIKEIFRKYPSCVSTPDNPL